MMARASAIFLPDLGMGGIVVVRVLAQASPPTNGGPRPGQRNENMRAKKKHRSELSNERNLLRWFAVRLLLRSHIGGTPSLRPLCEERVVLFRGPDEATVRTMATAYARGEEHSYANVYGEHVEWRFVAIEQVDALDDADPGKGWEVASRFCRRSLRTLEKHGQETGRTRRRGTGKRTDTPR